MVAAVILVSITLIRVEIIIRRRQIVIMRIHIIVHIIIICGCGGYRCFHNSDNNKDNDANTRHAQIIWCCHLCIHFLCKNPLILSLPWYFWKNIKIIGRQNLFDLVTSLWILKKDLILFFLKIIWSCHLLKDFEEGSNLFIWGSIGFPTWVPPAGGNPSGEPNAPPN